MSGAVLRALQADITGLKVEAIVNAANSALLGGGGVDGAIHRAAGPRLLEACRALQGCPVGAARITPGFALPARWVIHTVGPVWQGGHRHEAELLAACYRHCLQLADRHAIGQLAFPAISTGVYAYPREAAARIAVRTVRESLAEAPSVREVMFCCFSGHDLGIYRSLLQA